MPENKDAQNEIEAELSQFRIIQLQLDPVQGNFDVAHLKEINRRIFQDFPAAGLVQTPGEFRPPVASGDWIKTRLLSSQPVQYTVAYSRMDAPAQARLHRKVATSLHTLSPNEDLSTLLKTAVLPYPN